MAFLLYVNLYKSSQWIEWLLPQQNGKECAVISVIGLFLHPRLESFILEMLTSQNKDCVNTVLLVVSP